MKKEVKYITDQRDSYTVENVPMKDISFGLGNISNNGCGVIAAYNLLVSQGIEITFEEVRKGIIKKHGLNLFGLLGVNPFGLAKYLKAYFGKGGLIRWKNKKRRSRIDGSAGIIVLVKWRRSLEMHYMAGIRKEDTFTFYNSGIDDDKNNSIDGKSIAIEDFERYMKLQGVSPICVYCI